MKAVLIGTYGHQGYIIAAARELKNVQICGVACVGQESNLPNLMRALSELHIFPKVYENWRHMLDIEHPDIASVAPMFCQHQPVSIECLQRGIHVLCEKPVAITLDELDALEKVHQQSEARFVGMHGTRWKPNFMSAFHALKAGTIGRPLLINSQKSYTFGRRPKFYSERAKYGGTLSWVAIHAIDWCYWFAGPFTTVYAMQSTLGNHGYGECESCGVIAFSFRAGGLGCINFDFLRAGKDVLPQDRCRIAGEKGVIEIVEEKAWICTHEHERTELPLEKSGNVGKAFIEAILQDRECMLTARETFEITRHALLARESADRGVQIHMPHIRM